MQHANRPFWQDECSKPDTIRESPIYSIIIDNEILVKVHAWAVNPCDVLLQDQALPFITHPFRPGEDCAGVIERVGSAAATTFQVGDRITGLATSATSKELKHGAFQDYVVLDYRLACKIPERLSFREASVFPLAIITSSFALFHQDYLGLPFPSVNSEKINKSVLIWGGSSAVGSNAIQLAKAAGFHVITTCSARNFGYVERLGADKTFECNNLSIVDDVAAHLDQTKCAGIYHAAGKVATTCLVSYKSEQKPFVATSTPPLEGDVPEGVTAKFTVGSGGINMFLPILPATFGSFLPEALAAGLYKVAPPPEVVPTNGSMVFKKHWMCSKEASRPRR
ncbi:hypothetical protein M433DRAFT_303381 [Acidomyces richmondensis BFW]|nr:MAG: hypothetical protein FE78DRAFT_72401 [Acidomyces sp. 'richmondensis']KYG44438.1 hypothetical protein M433DRAFT_303381 [Acidomyces richmondensis BFW]